MQASDPRALPDHGGYRIAVRVLAALSVLLLTTGAVYAGVADHDFIIVDDGTYVFMNPWVMEGLTLPGAGWALSSFAAFNWHPLTWISHMADVTLVGPEPGGQHLVNVAFHLLNTALLFVALRRLSGRDWESLLVAALFALHPMHVESVAWIAERKDVLSACFWFLALWAYAAYAEQPGIARYGVVALLVAAGLMAKPMVVTLPFVLLLLDVWPLRRVKWNDVPRFGWLTLEKAPLLGLSIAASLLTMIAQQPGVENTAEALPWTARAGNAAVAYFSYLRLTAWPDQLAAFYPHPGWVAPWKAIGATAVLAAITGVSIRERERRPYLLVGWLWFLGTLVPVIGLVQVGDQAMADRYSYVPHIGLFVMIAWAAADLIGRSTTRRAVVATASVGVLLALAVTTRAQVARWESTETLFEYTLSITEKNSFAHLNLATVLLFEERRAEARRHLMAAVEANPRSPEALNALGNLELQDGNQDQALGLYRRASAAGPWLFEAQLNTALVLDSRGELDEALPFYRSAAKLEPHHPGIQYQLGALFERKQAYRKAAAHYRRAIQLDPELGEARVALRRVRPHLSKPRRRRPDQSSESSGSM